jgi:hypothetical protein
VNTLAEIIEHHKMRAAAERDMLKHAIERRLPLARKDARDAIQRHDDAVVTLQRAVADIERLQKAWEATR